MAQAPGREQFTAEVYPSEVRELAERRRRRGQPSDALAAAAAAEGEIHPSSEHGTFGLALSGGGIRSATFNLGLVQALIRHEAIALFDYVSTVSGGGYIGSTLNLALNREDPERGEPGHSLSIRHGGQDPETVKHLRSFSDYLAPNGLLDVLRIPAILLRGIATNVLVLCPLLALIALGTAWMYPDLPEDAHTFRITPWAFLALGVWILLFPPISTIFERSTFGRRSRYEGSFALLLFVGIGTFAVELLPYLYHRLFVPMKLGMPDYAAGAVATLVAIAPMASSIASAAFRGVLNKVLLVIVGILGPLVTLFIYLLMVHWLLHGDAAGLKGRMALLAVLMGGVYVFTRAFVSINKSGMHSFYRDRLSLAYLVDPESMEHDDEYRLQECRPSVTGAPYHLVNTALNMPATHNRELRGRATDFFLMSPKWCGSWQTGYASTDELEKRNSYLNLGTAMAISGAAASPVMGTRTSRLLIFVLTLLNIRLDYWLVNPARLASKKGLLSWLRSLYVLQVGPVYLLLELFGKLNERSKYVNLSDGGHLENLGLYELLRRRCRYIVVSDAGRDATYRLSALGQLQAFARIDLGINIEWTDLDEVRPGADGWVGKQWAHGRIDYGNGEFGDIVYVKLSLGGSEPRDVLSYAAKNPGFPHQSTGDQFFDESQFESYRALGESIGNQLFAGSVRPGDAGVGAWFGELRSRSEGAELDRNG